MLREAKNVNATHQDQLFGNGGGHIDLIVGMKRFRSFYKVRRSDFLEMVRRSRKYPVPFGYAGNRRYWRYGNRWFWEDEGLGAEQVRTLVALGDRRRRASPERIARTAPTAVGTRPRNVADRPVVDSKGPPAEAQAT